MDLSFKTPLPRLLASSLSAGALMCLMLAGWIALSDVKESLVTDWWEAPGLSADAERAPAPAGHLP